MIKFINITPPYTHSCILKCLNDWHIDCYENFKFCNIVRCNRIKKNERAFSLAETLIAIVAIGVTAAFTLPVFIHLYQERVNSHRQANIVYKITQATNLMKANDNLRQFNTTMDFVNVLKKYLSIQKICDSDHIAECWPTKKVRASDGRSYDVSDFVVRSDLGFKDEYSDNPNVGVVLSDGAALIMTYNPASGGIASGDPLNSIRAALPVGNGMQEFLQYTTNTTGGLAFVVDVNGGRGPNSETIGTRHFDIRGFNNARFKGCSGIKLNGSCYATVSSPTAYNCASNPTNTYCATRNPHGQTYTGSGADYWAGAQNDCAAVGLRLPTISQMQTICRNESLRETLGLSGEYWVSQLPSNPASPQIAHTVIISGCSSNYKFRYFSGKSALCVE